MDDAKTVQTVLEVARRLAAQGLEPWPSIAPKLTGAYEEPQFVFMVGKAELRIDEAIHLVHPPTQANVVILSQIEKVYRARG
ncbi:hypothetical protein HOU03_gp322 [Caulobacter phage CcrSC]|uniref:Uncharacterized protein n=1 Tax=Caulobacter phage CcrSC TaxID=2283272 RepID=A0A385EE48_9CAUD|nr:hypothetical protein HOU03_gp322 [Caulobacter phage CcrSC]AXQ69946.1 hypothetical protein CcrSC_gp364 [Caulobacter phage CcrSC]